MVESALTMFELRVFCQGKEWAVPLPDGVHGIGRAPSCAISVPDPNISGDHATLKVERDRLFVHVIEGRRPIEINGRFASTAQLKGGSCFTLGSTTFIIVSARDNIDLIDVDSVIASAKVDASGSGATLPGIRGPAHNTVKAEPNFVPTQPTSVRLLAQVYNLLRHATDQQTLARGVLDLACNRLMATRAMLASVEDPEELKVIAVRGMSETGTDTNVSISVLKKIISARQAVLIGDTTHCSSSSDKGRHDSFFKKNIRAVACTPIFKCADPDKLMALLYIDNQDRATQFSSHEAEVLIWLGQVYALLAENLAMRRQLECEVVDLKRSASQSLQVVSESPAMINVLCRAKKAADSEAAVLILGESGVGKECIASLIHRQSPRASKSFVARNCAAIPENLFESEMFGHKKGAFTGADKERQGAFIEANGGTLFLDEIGDLAYSLQTKLLRAIQERVVRPVGSDREYPVDIRIVCATNKNLRECCARRDFREDLFYRLATVTINVPPLRERREDILLLAQHFVRSFSNGMRTLTRAAEERLLTHNWPGNVRELRSVLEEAVIFSTRNQVDADDINLPQSSATRIQLGGTSIADAERRHILQVLESVGGNRSEAAKVLRMARSTLLLKLKSYKLGE